ncbi:hypothetical protein XCR1_1630003 [Xenorhabdus cabanillasii JM26]|uniref:Uncharacterized protein n=1 Tax=Xenorhabdus cabanillasii JM26 TaxID=1427517 RepID=W1IXT3_9GAMM|nr:hypothetical protein XCR1_1630003 [Xenorhabdus cabanillasii JM26]
MISFTNFILNKLTTRIVRTEKNQPHESLINHLVRPVINMSNNTGMVPWILLTCRPFSATSCEVLMVKN